MRPRATSSPRPEGAGRHPGSPGAGAGRWRDPSGCAPGGLRAGDANRTRSRLSSRSNSARHSDQVDQQPVGVVRSIASHRETTAQPGAGAGRPRGPAGPGRNATGHSLVRGCPRGPFGAGHIRQLHVFKLDKARPLGGRADRERRKHGKLPPAALGDESYGVTAVCPFRVVKQSGTGVALPRCPT